MENSPFVCHKRKKVNMSVSKRWQNYYLGWINHLMNKKQAQFFHLLRCEWSEWSDVWPSMVTHTRNLCSAFNPSKCTHTQWTHTQQWTHHTVNTHSEQWAARGAVGGSVPCSRASVVGLKVEESAGYSLPPPTIPAGPETRTHNLRVTSLTLYPLGHDCPVFVFTTL